MKKIITASVLGLSLVMSSAQANDVNPWKQCGIGAMIFDDNTTAAAISNVIWDLGTTAVSSKISSVDSCAGNKNVAAAELIQHKTAAIESDVVMGAGDSLASLMDVLEVKDRDLFASAVQADLLEVAATADYQKLDVTAKAQAIYAIAVKHA